MSLNDWITLDVGGRQFSTTRLTLVSCPDSLLTNMFSLESSRPPAAVSPDGAFKIDADPDAFAVLLNWLRRKQLMMNDRTNLESVAIEAEFFGLTDLKDELERKKKIKEEQRIEDKAEQQRKENKEEEQRNEDKAEQRRWRREERERMENIEESLSSIAAAQKRIVNKM